ncbi:MAG: GTP 3',8-cyclase MoaA [Anaerolineales bacterium]|nr:GTP 3',8-cyclase MoaA [Anaerolineales bacterium]
MNRPLRDLRISVTDRCNFRCRYCMPKEVFGSDYAFLPRQELLTFGEIIRLSKLFHQLGLQKIRLTGGEPLLRKDLEVLVGMLRSALPDVELALTTNASILAPRAAGLKEAGLDRVTVSLDALDDEIFQAINDVGFPVERVLDGIQTAEEAGFEETKINMVVKRGVNENEILPMAAYFREKGHILRFIEYMDVGSTNNWQSEEVVPAKEIAQIVHQAFPLKPLEPNYRGEVASRWKYRDGKGEIGLIASVTQPFCGDCTRLRLSAVGQLFTCLFATEGHDLRQLLRKDQTDQEILSFITSLWQARDDSYSEDRHQQKSSGDDKVEMHYIGG